MSRSRTVLCCLLSLALPAVACDSKEGEPKADAKKDDGAKDDAKKADGKNDEDGAVLKLGAAKLFEKDDPTQAMVLATDGTVTVEGKKVGTIGADGKLTLTDGKLVLEVKADGTVVINDKVAPLKLEDSGGTITMGNKSVSFAFKAGGEIDMQPAPDNPGLAMAHEGCDAIPKTCAVAMFALLTPGEAEAVEGGVPSEVPAAVPAAEAPAPPTKK